MADPRFFERAGPFTLSELAERAGADIHAGDPDGSYIDVAPLDSAGAQDVSFLDNKLYVEAFSATKAGLCLVSPKFVDRAPEGMALLVANDPYTAYARVAQAFYPKSCFTHAPQAGVHERATLHDTASVGTGCWIDAGAVIGAGAEIGAQCSIGANSYIGPGVILGEGCHVGPNVTIQFAIIGARCVFHPGARIGQDGFGFAPGAQHTKVPQLGRVIIEDDVDIGANACVDRGTGPDTVIRAGTKIDNMVQVGHNVEIGRGCLFPALSGISGSTKIGSYVMMGGGTGIAGHLTIGDGARIAAHSGIMRDVAPGETVAGAPAVPAKEFWRQIAALKKLTHSKKGA